MHICIVCLLKWSLSRCRDRVYFVICTSFLCGSMLVAPCRATTTTTTKAHQKKTTPTVPYLMTPGFDVLWSTYGWIAHIDTQTGAPSAHTSFIRRTDAAVCVQRLQNRNPPDKCGAHQNGYTAASEANKIIRFWTRIFFPKKQTKNQWKKWYEHDRQT